mmetsp:Transcript_13362/g.31810  ORF Transcript_13362/g.31810 Transcript_13362/m.31810 type:complete len:233 (-) Transcript_13362:1326-2024(-)
MPYSSYMPAGQASGKVRLAWGLRQKMLKAPIKIGEWGWSGRILSATPYSVCETVACCPRQERHTSRSASPPGPSAFSWRLSTLPRDDRLGSPYLPEGSPARPESSGCQDPGMPSGPPRAACLFVPFPRSPRVLPHGAPKLRSRSGSPGPCDRDPAETSPQAPAPSSRTQWWPAARPRAPARRGAPGLLRWCRRRAPPPIAASPPCGHRPLPESDPSPAPAGQDAALAPLPAA